MAKNKYGGVNDMPVGWLAKKENKRVEDIIDAEKD